MGNMRLTFDRQMIVGCVQHTPWLTPGDAPWAVASRRVIELEADDAVKGYRYQFQTRLFCFRHNYRSCDDVDTDHN
jgi:hypothetical protein